MSGQEFESAASVENQDSGSSSKAIKVKNQSSSLTNDPTRFQFGVLLRGKFIGVEDVKKENGDDICQTAMIKLKAVVEAKKEHKQRICIKINLDGIEILDEKTNQTMFKHSVNRISYIARDVKDSRAIGYIYKNSPNNFQYFAIKTERQAQELFNTLKDLFEVVLEMRNGSKKESKEDKNNEPNPAELKSNESNEQIITGLEEKIKQMNEQPLLLSVPSHDTKNSLESPTLSSSENLIDPTPSQPNANPSSELLDLFETTGKQSNVVSSPPQIQIQNDKYLNLVNELAGLTTILPQKEVQISPFPTSTSSLVSDQFSINNKNLPTSQYIPNQNPFGSFQSGTLLTNNSIPINQPQIPIQQMPNINLYQPNQTGLLQFNQSKNQQNSSSHFPW